MHYRHLKRIARGEAKLNAEAKVYIAYDNITKTNMCSVVVDQVKDIMVIPGKTFNFLTGEVHCIVEQENPMIWIGLYKDNLQIACGFDLIEFSKRLIKIPEKRLGYFLMGQRTEIVFDFLANHLIWKLKKKGVKPKTIESYRIKRTAYRSRDAFYKQLNKVLILYLQNYGD